MNPMFLSLAYIGFVLSILQTLRLTLLGALLAIVALLCFSLQTKENYWV